MGHSPFDLRVFQVEYTALRIFTPSAVIRDIVFVRIVGNRGSEYFVNGIESKKQRLYTNLLG